ncbi:hypothetical protein HPB47_013256 [Ixodes persulcatus]|uniref:Uncharacterized protein n=1 Tax=Ixodes persulcatus TaxID=34615 RepID=A0AC60R136_IXOPE|nr:hypothetical protein HPB47_013256 [Ixodes persulcatus]
MELSLASGPIPEYDEIIVLDLFIPKHRRVDTTLAKLRKVGDQVDQMVRRVSNKRGRLRRVLYSTPYLHLRKFDETALEVLLRKMYNRVLDLSMNTSSQRLMGLGMVSTFAELREAHLTNQYTRLSKDARVRIPEVWRYALHVCPLPANMTRDDHSGRRLARTSALARPYGTKPGIFYVNASGPHHGGWYTIAVVHENVLVSGLTFRAQGVTHAEEIAIALAAADQDSRVIITDSTVACRNIEQGYIPLFAYRILKDSDYLGAPAFRTIVWAPAPMGLEGNETANTAARAITLQATPSDPSETNPKPNSALTFREITGLYQFGHAN